MTADQLAAWRKALAKAARAKRTRRATRAPAATSPGMVRAAPARVDGQDEAEADGG